MSRPDLLSKSCCVQISAHDESLVGYYALDFVKYLFEVWKDSVSDNGRVYAHQHDFFSRGPLHLGSSYTSWMCFEFQFLEGHAASIQSSAPPFVDNSKQYMFILRQLWRAYFLKQRQVWFDLIPQIIPSLVVMSLMLPEAKIPGNHPHLFSTVRVVFVYCLFIFFHHTHACEAHLF